MRLLFKSFASLAALALCAGLNAQAQSSSAPVTGNGTYIAIDPLANVRYDNRFDVSLGMAYGHIMAGTTLEQGANLGGLDLSGSYWLLKHWGVEGTGRAYLGSSGAGATDPAIKGPFVTEDFFAVGPEWLGPHNKHGALIAHVLVGGARFDAHTGTHTAQQIDFYPNQVAPAAIFGGHIDLNRSAHWVFRITPDALFTRYSINYLTVPVASSHSEHDNWNFGISVGIEYKFKKKR